MFTSLQTPAIPWLPACLIAVLCSFLMADSVHGVIEMPKAPAIEEIRSKVLAYSRVSTHPAARIRPIGRRGRRSSLK